MKLFEANVRVTRHERWTVEAIEIEGARRKFQLGTSDVKDDAATGELTDWEVYAVHEIPACTCGGDPGQPAEHHDISCPDAVHANDLHKALHMILIATEDGPEYVERVIRIRGIALGALSLSRT